MKSLQNKLNLIKEGKGNKELFLKEARAMFPNVVTGALTFDQAVHNLTERGILSEGFIGVSSKKPNNPDWFQIFNENVKADLKKPDTEVEKMETVGYDYKDQKNSNNLPMESILSGYYAEMRDPKNAEKTEEELKEIVVKNLTKDPLYYMKDGVFGIKGIGYTDKHPGLGATKEVTGKFKSSGMEPVKLNEGMYAGSDGDYEHDREMEDKAYRYYDLGMQAYSEGDYLKADRYYKGALKAGAWLGWTEQDLPPYGDKHLEESNVREYLGGMSKEEAMTQAQKNSLEGYVQHVEDNGDGTYSVSDWYDSDKTVASYENGMPLNEAVAKSEEAHRYMMQKAKEAAREAAKERKKKEKAEKTKDGMSEYLGGRLEVPQNYGMDFDDEEDDYEDEDEKYYDEEGNTIPLRSPLHPRNRNMEENNAKLKDTQALAEAKHPMEKAVKEIEKKSELAKAEAKINQIEELISELESKLTMTEADGMSDMVDKKKVKEIQKNIKFLEAKKKRYDKEKSRLEGRYGKKKKEIMDEVEEPKKMGYAEAVKEMLRKKGLKK